jgi:glutathione S-transferase
VIAVYSIPGSPFGRAVLAACIEKQAPYRLSPVVAGEHRQAPYTDRHPFARIPCIDDGGFVLYETQAIVRYIDASYGAPRALQPADAKTAARMDQVMGIIDWYFFAPSGAIPLIFNRYVAPRLGFPVDEAAAMAAVPATRRIVGVLEGFLKDSPYMAGEAFTLADIHAGGHFDVLSDIPEGAEMLQGSPILPWLERLRARPSFANTTWERLTQSPAAA